jgi:hypothetical protein
MAVLLAAFRRGGRLLCGGGVCALASGIAVATKIVVAMMVAKTPQPFAHAQMSSVES